MAEIREVTNKMLEEDIHESIIQYVDSFINQFETDTEKAIAIYIKISQLFSYDPRFLVDRDYSCIDNLGDITIVNNNIICLHWAVIYSKLLNNYGVCNRIIGDDQHLSVKVSTSDFIMFADATKHGVEYRDYNLSDLTNTKLGFKIRSLATLSSAVNKELDVVINQVYKKLNLDCYDISMADNLVEKFRYYSYRRIRKKEIDGQPKIDKKEIERRISFINKFYYLFKELGEVEKLQVLSKYYKDIFYGFNFDNSRCITMCEHNDNIYSLLKLIVLADSEDVYYYLESSYGFVEYSKEQLVDTFLDRNIYFKYDRCGVLGFEDEEIKKLIKK